MAQLEFLGEDLLDCVPVFPEPKRWSMAYDEDTDIFSLFVDENRAAVAIDVMGIWVRIVPQYYEVVGLEIEDFESSFLGRYPDIASTWKEYKLVRSFTERQDEPEKRRSAEMLVNQIMQVAKQAFPLPPRRTSIIT